MCTSPDGTTGPWTLASNRLLQRPDARPARVVGAVEVPLPHGSARNAGRDGDAGRERPVRPSSRRSPHHHQQDARTLPRRSAMARKFFYVCAGMFLLALSYHFGAASAGAQVAGNIECVGFDERWGIAVIDHRLHSFSSPFHEISPPISGHRARNRMWVRGRSPRKRRDVGTSQRYRVVLGWQHRGGSHVRASRVVGPVEVPLWHNSARDAGHDGDAGGGQQVARGGEVAASLRSLVDWVYGFFPPSLRYP